MNYTPHTPEDIERALQVIGVDSIDDLFSDIPAELIDPEIELNDGIDEVTLMNHMRDLAARNKAASPFTGGGVRKHFIPSVTGHLAMQSEFVTSYTPYQPEVSQGILQATFEYQTMIAELTGLPVSNASMYDDASAAAEAALLACRQTGRDRIAISRGVNPETRDVVATYLQALDIEIDIIELDGVTTGPLELGEEVAGLLMQQPNHLGYLEDMDAASAAAHEAGALAIAVVDPLSLGVLKSPGDYGADVAVGDGQAIGNPLAFGGPTFGFMAVRSDLIRQLPGRLVGETTDVDGKRAFVLTLQAREQHIRRSKAKSNICTNHQLMAIMAAINLGALGPQGLKQVAVGTVHAAHHLAGLLEEAGKEVLPGRFFAEFVIRTNTDASELRRRLAERGVLAGVPIGSEYGFGNALLLSATELSTEQERVALAELISEVDK